MRKYSIIILLAIFSIISLVTGNILTFVLLALLLAIFLIKFIFSKRINKTYQKIL